MKTKNFLTAIFLTLTSAYINGQIITGNVNKAIPCCYSADSLDIDADSKHEIIIESWVGFDNLWYDAIGGNNTELNGALVPINSSFPDSAWGKNPPMPYTIVGVDWIGWVPNSGFKYLGFRRINSPSDTTFGWVKLDFKGTMLSDTVFILQYAYSTIPNIHLNAGQTTIASVKQIFIDNIFKVFPNPFSTQTTLQTNHLFTNTTLTVDNFCGQTVKQISQISNEAGEAIILHRGNLPVGLYFIRLTEEGKVIATDKLVISDN